MAKHVGVKLPEDLIKVLKSEKNRSGVSDFF
jgi:hypothetical protein